MILFATMGSGFLLGLAYFGGLWLSVRRLLRRKQRLSLFNAEKALRLLLFGTTVALLGTLIGAAVVGILPGFWLARWCVVRLLVEAHHGQ
jgi:hypothetical protein